MVPTSGTLITGGAAGAGAPTMVPVGTGEGTGVGVHPLHGGDRIEEAFVARTESEEDGFTMSS